MTHPIRLFDLCSEDDFNAAIAARLINIREDGTGLRILNYSSSAMYTPGAWDNSAVRQCRGLIIDSDWHIIGRPWAKFFNHGQVEAGDLDLDAAVEVTDKMDGSLGIIYLALDGTPRVASRGSFESDQAVHATRVLHARYPRLGNLESVTPLVEIIYPENRIVVDYGDNDDLVLLGGVDIASGEYLSPLDTALFVGWGGPVAKIFEYETLRDALAAPPRPGMEGMCVRRLDKPHIVKIKQEDYVKLHRIITGLSERSVWDHMMAGLPFNDLLDGLPDELHSWVGQVWATIYTKLDYWTQTSAIAHAAIVACLPDGWTRKDYATEAAGYGDLRRYLFLILDGKDVRQAILRSLKPTGDTRARPTDEAVA